MKRIMKVGLFGIVVMLGLVLVGCGKSAQEKFTDSLKTFESTDNNAAAFSMKFDKLNLSLGNSDSMTDATVSMVLSALKDATLSGEYQMDKENKIIDYQLEMNVMNQKIPLDFMVSEDKIYYSGDSFSQIFEIVSSFTSASGTGGSFDYSGAAAELDGKYVVMSGDDLADFGSTVGTLPDFSSMTSSSGTGTILQEYVQTLDKDSFEEKDGVVSHTFNKKEIGDLITFAKKNGDDSVKEMFTNVEAGDITEAEGLEKLNLKVSFNEKNKMTIKMTAVAAQDSGNLDVGMTVTVTPKKVDKTLKLPSNDQTVTMDEVTTLMQENAKYTLSDEEFDMIYSNLKNYAEYYTKEEVDDMLSGSGYSLTDEQQAKIDALFTEGV